MLHDEMEAHIKFDAHRAHVEGDHTIRLKKAHTVVMCAATHGGMTVRGAFIMAIAKMILENDGNTDIYEMFIHACQMMEAHSSYFEQIPIMQSTLMRKLGIPKLMNG